MRAWMQCTFGFAHAPGALSHLFELGMCQVREKKLILVSNWSAERILPMEHLVASGLSLISAQEQTGHGKKSELRVY